MTTRALIARVLVERRRVLAAPGHRGAGEPRRVRARRLPAVVESGGLRASRRDGAGAAGGGRTRRHDDAGRAAARRAGRRGPAEVLPRHAAVQCRRRAAHELREAGEPGGPPRADHRAAQLRSRHGYRGRLHKLKINMALSGEYRDIRAFLHALETAPEFVVIEDVSLSEGAQSGRAAGGGRAAGDLLRWSARWRLRRVSSLCILGVLLAILLVVVVYNREADPVGATTVPARLPVATEGQSREHGGGCSARRAEPAAPGIGGGQPQPVSLPRRRAAAPSGRRGATGARGPRLADWRPVPPVPEGPPPPPPIALKFIGTGGAGPLAAQARRPK